MTNLLRAKGDFSGARTALQKFIGLCNPTVAKVWKFYADTLPDPATAPAPENST
jgi:hypothetical protein